MKPIMYLFLNRGLGMSTGKVAAQAGHAAVAAYKISDPDMITAWELGGHYTKVVLLAEDSAQLTSIAHYLSEREFLNKVIVDEGRTEIAPFSPTCIGVEIVDKDNPHTAATFGSFQVYKEKPLSALDLRDQETERGFMQMLRTMGIPIRQTKF